MFFLNVGIYKTIRNVWFIATTGGRLVVVSMSGPSVFRKYRVQISQTLTVLTSVVAGRWGLGWV